MSADYSFTVLGIAARRLRARGDVLELHAAMLAEQLDREPDDVAAQLQFELILDEQRHNVAVLRELLQAHELEAISAGLADLR